jgi:hypothetical protein
VWSLADGPHRTCRHTHMGVIRPFDL